MRIVVSDFISLDGVVQAPGGPGEDTDGGFRHGGWSAPYFDPDTMGPAVGEAMAMTDALLFGRHTWQTMAAVQNDLVAEAVLVMLASRPPGAQNAPSDINAEGRS